MVKKKTRIPTEEQFDEVIDVLLNCNTLELQSEVYEIPLHEDAILELVQRSRDLFTEKKERLANCAAHRWLLSQENGRDAMGKACQCEETRFGKRKSHDAKWAASILLGLSVSTDAESVQKFIEQDASFAQRIEKIPHTWSIRYKNKIDAYVAFVNDDWEKRRYVVKHITAAVYRTHSGWHRGLYAALRSYHYSDRWERIMDEYDSKMKYLRKAQYALQNLEWLSSNIIAPLSIGFGEHSFARAKKLIDIQIEADSRSIYPIGRRDDTSRERVLLYDLYINNERHFHEAKISILTCLMHLDGINPISERRTKKLLSDWRASITTYREKMDKLLNEDKNDNDFEIIPSLNRMY